MTNVPVTIFTAQECKHITSKEAKAASSISQEAAWGVITGEDKLSCVDFKKHTVSLVDDANVNIPLYIMCIKKMFNGEEYLQIIN
jgi:hypothetical protein